MVAGALVPAALLVAVPAAAFDTLELGAARLTPSLNGRLGLQHGTGINYGYGAIDSPGERERWTLYLAAKPRLDVEVAVTPADAFYGGFSAVAATTTLDGEISGQVARAGDEALDTDHAFVGWRHGVLDLSFGGQEFSIGDGFIIGDGNFNQGGEDGQYWTGIVFPEMVHFPGGEKSSYTAASIVLAADALSGTTPASGLFVDHDLLPELALVDAEDHLEDPVGDNRHD